MKTVNALHREKKGKASDKWSIYLGVYDRIFLSFREIPLRLLEIGVQNGGSLEVWSQYFVNHKKIVGCDINPKCGELHYEDSRVEVVVGDANTEDTFRRIVSLSPEFDIVIDDGSHVSDDIINSFLIYFPLLAPGGTYVVEDTHCLYWDAFKGGLLKQNSAQAFFKLFVDLINYEHWRNDLSIEALFATFFSREDVPSILTSGWIERIEFVNSMIIISKAMVPGHAKLGERVIVGEDAKVVAQTLELRESLDRAR